MENCKQNSLATHGLIHNEKGIGKISAASKHGKQQASRMGATQAMLLHFLLSDSRATLETTDHEQTSYMTSRSCSSPSQNSVMNRKVRHCYIAVGAGLNRLCCVHSMLSTLMSKLGLRGGGGWCMSHLVRAVMACLHENLRIGRYRRSPDAARCKSSNGRDKKEYNDELEYAA
eukprot:6177140-Pleurochrysis_carterae.AAC.3